MILFQAAVLALTILLLTVDWFRFLQAKSELNAKAAETPVINEIKALHKSIKQLLIDIEESADRADSRLEKKCGEARNLVQSLELKLASLNAAPMPTAVVAAEPAPVESPLFPTLHSNETSNERAEYLRSQPFEMSQFMAGNSHRTRNRRVFDMADAGSDRQQIARTTGMSEGEVETLLGLRIRTHDNK